MWFCLSAAAVLLLSGEARQRPVDLDVREPIGRRQIADDLVLMAEEVFQATVREVLDGDSVVVRDLGRRIRVRLDGVDAPELSQPFGGESRGFLERLLLDKAVRVRRKSKGEAGGESIARVDLEGRDVSTTLVAAGMAWYCPRHAEARELAAAEESARSTKEGLWREGRPTPPWKHRGAAECWEDVRGR